MKQVSTLFLEGVIFLIAIAVMALCVFGLPAIAREAAEHFPKLIYLSFLIGVYTAAIPFYIALHQALLLLSYADKNEALSEPSILALRNIKFCAIAIGACFMFALPLVYKVADLEDAPGVMALGLVVTGAPFVVATFAAVLEKIFRKAVEVKSENDLTV